MKIKLYFLGAIICPGIQCLHAQEKHDLVEIKKIIPTIALDIRYATTNNFTGKQLYESACCFARAGTVEKLKKVQAELAKKDLGLKIWDAYRPRSMQFKLWQTTPDKRYISDPKKGSIHNRGCAIDCTLIRLKDKSELKMPTTFDDFSPKAHISYTNLPKQVLKNRDLLARVMIKHGFATFINEWWHFNDTDWKKYSLLDKQFSKLVRKK